MEDRIYKFAEFELDLADGVLRNGTALIRLQEKPLLLLHTLLDHPQRLVTREQLRDRMWPARAVVDFDHGINAAMWKLREALGDSAEQPRLIETIARKGYRLRVPVSVDEPVAMPTASKPESANLPPAPSMFRRRPWHLSAAAGLLGLLGVLGLLGSRLEPRHPVQIRSIAVLPLQDLSPEPGQEYFADGVTEEITTDLAQTLPLRVISRTSVMRYKGTHEPVTQIARELGVDAVVEGAVARSGGQVTLTAQLIDARADRHLWAQTYERRIEDVMVTEAMLSQAVAGQVGGALSQRPAAASASHPVDSQAHDLWLLGRYHLDKRTIPGLTKAGDYFRAAVARDPHYAAAYAGLAEVYALWPSYAGVEHQDEYAKATAAARRALELDDSLGEAHSVLGLIGLNTDPDLPSTERELRQGVELNPNNALAHGWLGYYLLQASRRDAALAEMERARQLDPLSASRNADEGYLLYMMRRFEEARIRLRQAVELEPELGEPHEILALVELESGHPSQAVLEARAGLALDPDRPRTLGEAGYVLAATGQKADAERLLAKLLDVGRADQHLELLAALVELGLGRRDSALDRLARQATAVPGYPGLRPLWVNQYHAFEALNADLRYRQLLAQAR